MSGELEVHGGSGGGGPGTRDVTRDRATGTSFGRRKPHRSLAERVLQTAFHLLIAVLAIGTTSVSAQEQPPGEISPSFIKNDVYCASFVSHDEGWVVGTFGSIYHTRNGGRTWTKEHTGTMRPLFSVSFADAQNGWAVGKAGTILHTADGGSTWRQETSPQTKHLFSVKAISPTTAWAVGDWGMITMTTDGGKTWEDRSLTEDIILYGIDFSDDNCGWIAGEVGHLMFTQDGGKTWTPYRTATKKSLFGIHIADPEHAWAVGLDGEIWQFLEGSWIRRDNGGTGNTALYDVAVDGNVGWAVGDYGTAMTSSDGGVTWQNVDVPDDYKLYWFHTITLMQTPEGLDGIITGADGLLLWIRNGQIETK